MKTQTMPLPEQQAKPELVPAKLYVRPKAVKPEPVNLNDIDVITPEIDYMSDKKADWLLVVGVVIMFMAAAYSWFAW